MTSTDKFTDFWHASMLAALTACMAVGLAEVAHSATPDAGCAGCSIPGSVSVRPLSLEAPPLHDVTSE